MDKALTVRIGLAALLSCLGMAGQPGLDDRMKAAAAEVQGTVSLYAKNLDTGDNYGMREDERVRTASTIKVAIMASVFNAVADGKARWTDVLPLTGPKKVSGSGVVPELSNGVRLPIRDLMHLMIVVSDNTATNMLLERFPGNSVNAMMDKMDLGHTRSLRMILGDGANLKAVPSGLSAAGNDPDNQRFGIGVSTPREMVMLLEKIELGRVVSPAASKEMIAILKRQQYKDGIGRHVSDAVASKSGSLDHLRSDVGIVYTKGGRIALAITVDDMPGIDYSADNVGNLAISKLTGILLEGLKKKP